ncbi:unnamed protein product [Brachionus calyciflorus]|uniref:ISXO2-like transposase domain-containing protein n=1 Tax=Brachionus calyciflorus TaxID=104777 RepID=A0A813PBH2_9BILA|nr:unnamed protein product [Brachionus calyciflorus]
MNTEKSEQELIENFQSIGLIPKEKRCPKCDCVMQIKSRKRENKSNFLLYNWRCTKCASFFSLYEGTFFGIFKIPILIICQLIKCWSLEIGIAKSCELNILDEIKISRYTVSKIFKYLRLCCCVFIDKTNIKLGGKSCIIEIDESLFGKVKYNKGKDLRKKKVWVFGLIERLSGRCYLQVVPNRKAETLLAIIYDHVLPGSIVYSDKWSSYNKISELYDNQNVHKTVNHSLNFVDPETLACTNKIESLWNTVKVRFREMRGCNKMYIQSYLDEFMWRWNNNLSRSQAFKEIFNVIGEVFNNVHKNDELHDHLKKSENDSEEVGELITNDDSSDECENINLNINNENFIEEINQLCFLQCESSQVQCDTFITLESNLISDLITEFHSHAKLLGINRRLAFINLNSHKRYILHEAAEELELFHWNKALHENSLKKCQRTESDLESKLKQLDAGLESLSLNKSPRTALQIEKAALKPPEISQETTTAISSVLTKPNQKMTNKKRGRPCKEKNLALVETEKEKVYNFRIRNK